MSQFESFGSAPSPASSLEEELARLRPKPRPIGWFAAGLVTVLSLGFALGYYVPLSHAHSTLLQAHEALAKKSQELDQALKSKMVSLKETEARRDELERFLAGEVKSEQLRKSALVIAEATAGNQLKAFVKAKLVVLEVKDEGLLANVRESSILRPRSDALQPSASQVLCPLADLLKREESYRVKVTTSGNPADEKKYWASAAARAGELASLLTTKCQVSEEKVEVVAVRAKEDAEPLIQVLIGPAEIARLRASDAPPAAQSNLAVNSAAD